MILYFCAYTDDRYVNLEHGHIPSVIKNLVDSAGDDADNALLADSIKIEKSDGYEMYRIKALRDFSEEDKKYFTDSELEILEKVVHRYGRVNTKTIEDESHREAPWKRTRLKGDIPYSLAVEYEDCIVEKEEIDLLMKISKR